MPYSFVAPCVHGLAPCHGRATRLLTARSSTRTKLYRPQTPCRPASQVHCSTKASPREAVTATSAGLYWTVGRSTARESTPRAVAKAITEAIVQAALPAPPDVVLVFVNGITDSGIIRTVHSLVSNGLKMTRAWKEESVVLGCTMDGSLTELCQVEIVAACLPGIAVRPFRIGQSDCPVNIDWRQDEWARLVGCADGSPAGRENSNSDSENKHSATTGPQFILLQHPEFVVDDLLAALDFAYPISAKVGGSAGSSRLAHSGTLFAADGTIHNDGVVGLALERRGPGVVFEVAVAQGVRPVGTRLQVLQVLNGNEIIKVQEITGTGVSVEGGPMQIVDMWKHMGLIDETDAELVGRYLGVEVEAHLRQLTPKNGPGAPNTTVTETPLVADDIVTADPDGADDVPVPTDILVRRIVGIDSETKAVAVDGPPVRLGAGVRFQVRDSASALNELEKLRRLVPRGAVGGLVVTDLERVALFGQPDSQSHAYPYVEMFDGRLGRLLGNTEIGPLPAPGFQKHFPIHSPGSAASTFQHSSSAVYLLVYNEEDYSGGDADI